MGTDTFVMAFPSFSSPRDEVEEKHKSSSYHRHSYHLLQHDSQDASAEQRYQSTPLSCMDFVHVVTLFVPSSAVSFHLWCEMPLLCLLPSDDGLREVA